MARKNRMKVANQDLGTKNPQMMMKTPITMMTKVMRGQQMTQSLSHLRWMQPKMYPGGLLVLLLGQQQGEDIVWPWTDWQTDSKSKGLQYRRFCYSSDTGASSLHAAVHRTAVAISLGLNDNIVDAIMDKQGYNTPFSQQEGR